jgi:hypothetical protein
MGNQVSLIPKVSYEDIQMIVYRNRHNRYSALLINTLPEKMQHCLIQTTVDYRHEERIINECIVNNPNIMIIVYGKNSNDITILNKYEQLTKLGFMNVYIYTGGLFEWLLLHEIYGKDLFKITKYEIDILKYRPKSVLLHLMSQGKNYEEDMSGYLGNSGGIMDNARSFIENIKTNQYVPDIAINIPPPSQSRRSGKEDRTSIFWSNNGNNSDGDADGSGSDNNSENETTDYENQQRKKSSSSIFSGLKWLFK